MQNILSKYGNNISSQNGEDGIIQKIFEILPTQTDYWCVEFGAWDGRFLSNTYELVANNNWHGVLIEGNRKKFPDLEKTYLGNPQAHLVNKLINFEGANTLDNILKKTPIPTTFDLLSIDIDGNDYYIWESIKVYDPKVVIIEFNQAIPSDIEFVQEKDFSLNQGNSLLSLIKLGKSKGYELIATTFCNGIFVKRDLFNLFEIQDNSITEMWDTELPTPRVFQLFDGTLMLTEEFTLNWHGYNVSKYDLQKLPKFLRHFGDTPSKLKLFRKVYEKIYKLFNSKKNN